MSPRLAAPPHTMTLSGIQTPLGEMVAGATEAFHLLEFVRHEGEPVERTLPPGVTSEWGRNDLIDRVEQEMEEYFAGVRREFTVPVEPRGTPFQRAAWEALRRIPFGETRSYGEQAAEMGRPRSVRAVGRANGANPIAIIIPCHRVIGADGRLTGYAAGVWRKERLLAIEGSLEGSLGSFFYDRPEPVAASSSTSASASGSDSSAPVSR